MASEIWVIIESDNVLLPDGTISGQIHQVFLSQKPLTHWGRVTYICVSKLTIIGSDNGLSPGVRFTKPRHALRPVVDPSQNNTTVSQSARSTAINRNYMVKLRPQFRRNNVTYAYIMHGILPKTIILFVLTSEYSGRLASLYWCRDSLRCQSVSCDAGYIGYNVLCCGCEFRSCDHC